MEQFETVDQAVDFIASAPFLEDLAFSSVGCSESCKYSSQAIAPPLRRIKFKPGPLVNNLMDWFCRSCPTPSVHTLDLNRLASLDNIPTVCNFIRHLGSALEDLLISCTNSDHEIRSKCIPTVYFINVSLITLIRCPRQTNRSIPEYFSSQYPLSQNKAIHRFTEATLCQ